MIRRVAVAFSQESDKRRNFANQVGSYFYNLVLLGETLGRTAIAKEYFKVSDKLGYDKANILVDVPKCLSIP